MEKLTVVSSYWKVVLRGHGISESDDGERISISYSDSVFLIGTGKHRAYSAGWTTMEDAVRMATEQMPSNWEGGPISVIEIEPEFSTIINV